MIKTFRKFPWKITIEFYQFLVEHNCTKIFKNCTKIKKIELQRNNIPVEVMKETMIYCTSCVVMTCRVLLFPLSSVILVDMRCVLGLAAHTPTFETY